MYVSYNLHGISVLFHCQFVVNEKNEDCKSREMKESFRQGKVDILGISDTHLKGSGVLGCRSADEKSCGKTKK